MPRLLLLALLLAPVAAARGQLRLGATGGVNFATITSDDGENIDMRAGPAFGAVAAWEFRPNLGFETGLLYSQQGAKGGAADGFDVRGELKVTYAQIPVQARVSLARDRARVRPFLVGGPALGIKVRCKLAARVGDLKAEIPCDDPDVDADIKTADFSLVVGGGVELGDVAVGVRYWHGLTTISDSQEAGGAKNRVIAVTGTLFLRSDRRR